MPPSPPLSLPGTPGFRHQFLAAMFRQRTASYKFYWFLALLNLVRDEMDLQFPVRELTHRMVALAWYPVSYFKLSFGKNDRLPLLIAQIKKETGLKDNASQEEILKTLSALPSSEARKGLKNLSRYVPYRFLKPFFGNSIPEKGEGTVEKRIQQAAGLAFYSTQPPPYRFEGKNLFLDKDWSLFFREYFQVLRNHTLWELTRFLHTDNPNVPGLSEKLLPPQKRSGEAGKEFWKTVFPHFGKLYCPYSQTPLTFSESQIDHFLPWRFVTHNLHWNLVPSLPSANASKSDTLPNPKLYLPRLSNLHHQAIRIYFQKGRKQKVLEDYVVFFNASLMDLLDASRDRFHAEYESRIQPQIQIAKNMGFRSDWVWT